MHLILAFEIGTILLAENDCIIGMQHKMYMEKTSSWGKHDLLFQSFAINIHLLPVHLFCCLSHRQAVETTQDFRKMYGRKILNGKHSIH